MDTRTGAIEIARVARLNSNGPDVRYEQLIDGKPEYIPGYPVTHVWGSRELSKAKTISAFSFSLFLYAIPVPLGICDPTNVDGVMVRSFGFRPSERAINKAKRAHTTRLSTEAVAV